MRKILVILTLLVVSIILSGCASKEENLEGVWVNFTYAFSRGNKTPVYAVTEITIKRDQKRTDKFFLLKGNHSTGGDLISTVGTIKDGQWILNDGIILSLDEKGNLDYNNRKFEKNTEEVRKRVIQEMKNEAEYRKEFKNLTKKAK